MRPVGLQFDQRVEDGGLRLGEAQGLGVTVDRAAIEAVMRGNTP